MELENSPFGTPANQVAFRQEPVGSFWIVFLVLGLIPLGIVVALTLTSWPPTGAKGWGLLVTAPVISIVMLAIAWSMFRARDDSITFYGDRAEFHKRGVTEETLRYEDVVHVAYGFRSSGEQILSFSGKDKKPSASIALMGAGGKGPEECSREKFLALRDYLYDIVASRMIEQSAAPQGAHWFDDLRITREGLKVRSSLIPWGLVTIRAVDNTGDFLVMCQGRQVGHTSMVKDNVVAGAMAVRALTAAHADVGQ